MLARVLLVTWMAAVAADGIPLRIIQMTPAHNGSAVSFVNTSTLVAMSIFPGLSFCPCTEDALVQLCAPGSSASQLSPSSETIPLP